jgi:two-component system, sensor histidine kinase YesM
MWKRSGMKGRFFIKNLLLFLFPLLIPVLILGTLSIWATRQYVQGEWSRNHLVQFNQIDRSMELLIHEMDSLYVSLGNADMLYRLEEIMRTQTLTLENLRLVRTVQNFMNGPANSKPYLESIYVYVNNDYGQFLASGAGLAQLQDFHDTTWKNSLDTHAEETGFWTETRPVRRYSFESPYPVTTIYRNLAPTVQSRPSGAIVVNVYADYIAKLLDNLVTAPGQRLLVVDEENRILFQSHTPSREDVIPVELIPAENSSFDWRSPDGELYSVSQASSGFHWRYLSLTPHQSLNQVPFRLSTYTGWLVLLSLVLGMAVTGILTWRNMRHIRRLISIIHHAEQGIALPDVSLKTSDEYGYISQKVITTFIERHYLTVQLSEKKYRLQAAELLALQAQINPHFLYNTLETINWKVLALTDGPNEANRMLAHLAGLLKYSLDTPGKVVAIEEEIRNTRNYIRLQEIRSPGRFQVVWQYDTEELADTGIIKLLLQPLVENSILHGLHGKDGEHRIKIKISRIAGGTWIAVIDNGSGMSKERLEEVRHRIEAEDEAYEHIGLANTHKRLLLTYQTGRGLTIQSKPGWGTVISMTFPSGGSIQNRE